MRWEWRIPIIGLLSLGFSCGVLAKDAAVPLPQEIQIRTLAKVPVSESEVRGKVAYARRLFTMKSAQRILNSSHEQAIALLDQAQNKAVSAEQALVLGEFREANMLINQCYRTLVLATTLVPSQHQLTLEKGRHKTKVAGLAAAKKLHQEAYQATRNAHRRVEYDSLAVYQLEQQALVLADEYDYFQANQHLQQARMIVDLATMAMLDKQTITYAVDVSTPEKEFQYEAGRFRSYEELVPVAIEMKSPNTMQLILINRKVDAGEWKAEQAHLTAATGDLPKAIRMIMDASAEIRKALKLMKVELYE